MGKKNCEKCKHFVQHFSKYKGNYMKAYCGRCIHPRMKPRKPDTPACRHFAPREEDLPDTQEN